MNCVMRIPLPLVIPQGRDSRTNSDDATPALALTIGGGVQRADTPNGVNPGLSRRAHADYPASVATRRVRGRTVCLLVGCTVLALTVVGPARADPTFGLTGTLTTSGGTPVCGQIDVADPASGTSVGAAITDGTFSLTVPAGDEVVTVTDGGCATSGLPAAWALPAFARSVSADTTLDIALPAAVPLTLAVVSSGGTAVAGAEVSGSGVADPFSSAVGPLAPTQTLAGTTDDAGNVTLWAFPETDLASLVLTGDASASPPTAEIQHLQLLAAKSLPLALGPAGTPRAYSPPGPPTTVLAFPTGLPTAPKVRVSWLAPASTGGFALTGYVATATPAGASVSSSPALTSVLIAGLNLSTAYTFSVVASNLIGPGAASDPSAVVIPGVFDTTPPVPAMTGPLLPVALAPAAVVTWTATDLSGIGSYDLRWRIAHADGVFGGLITQTKLTGTTATKANLAIAAGTTMCFSVRAKDRAGNVSDWTAERCTTRPFDDAALVASLGWTVTTPSSAYGRTLSTGSLDATLGLAGASFQQLTVVVNTCRTCGTLEVSVDGVVIGTIDTHSAGTKVVRKVLLTLAVTDGLPIHSGAVSLRVSSPGHSVQVDGLALVAPFGS